MKHVVLIFLFIFAVPSSQIDMDCVQKYVKCSVPVLNRWQEFRNCSVAVPFIKCITDVSGECDTHAKPTLEKVEGILVDICSPNSAIKKELNKTAECVAHNLNSSHSCIKDLPEDSCKASKSILECTSETVHETCGAFAGNLTDQILAPMQLLVHLCMTAKDVNDTEECLMNNIKTFYSCKLTGEFNTAGDICSSTDGYVQCLVAKSEEVCGAVAKRLVQNYTELTTFFMQMCKNITYIQRIPIPECDKAVLKCNVNLYNVGERKCTDLSNYLGCLTEAAPKCKEEVNPFSIMVLEKYKNKFPEYCDKDSAFNKNAQKEGVCIYENSGKVVATCFPKLQKDIHEVTMADVAGNQRAYFNFLQCLKSEFGEKCNREAGDAINDLVVPLADSLDESCRLLTGKRCNSACGLKVATWVFIASLAYLLTRRYE